MKQITAITLLCIVMIGCDTLTRKRHNKGNSDYTSSSFDEERARQIENAKQNRDLIPGKWQIIKLKDSQADKFQPIKKRYKELDFDTYEFLPQSQYIFYKGKKIVEKGTIEWMAEDREIVFTPDNDSPVGRLLIRGINQKYMNANSRTIYMILKKVLPDSSNAKATHTASRKH